MSLWVYQDGRTRQGELRLGIWGYEETEEEDSWWWSQKSTVTPLAPKRNKTNDICIIPDISSHPQQLWLFFDAVWVFSCLFFYCVFLLQWLKVWSPKSAWGATCAIGFTLMGSGAAPRICVMERNTLEFLFLCLWHLQPSLCSWFNVHLHPCPLLL